MLKKILPFVLPAPGENLYVEAFGGSGIVLLNKPPHPSETYNDLDGQLVNLFRVLRDPDGVVHLWWQLINTPVSREEFRTALSETKKEYSPATPLSERRRSFCPAGSALEAVKQAIGKTPTAPGEPLDPRDMA